MAAPMPMPIRCTDAAVRRSTGLPRRPMRRRNCARCAATNMWSSTCATVPGVFKITTDIGVEVPIPWTASGRLLLDHMSAGDILQFVPEGRLPPAGRPRGRCRRLRRRHRASPRRRMLHDQRTFGPLHLLPRRTGSRPARRRRRNAVLHRPGRLVRRAQAGVACAARFGGGRAFGSLKRLKDNPAPNGFSGGNGGHLASVKDPSRCA